MHKTNNNNNKYITLFNIQVILSYISQKHFHLILIKNIWF